MKSQRAMDVICRHVIVVVVIAALAKRVSTHTHVYELKSHHIRYYFGIRKSKLCFSHWPFFGFIVQIYRCASFVHFERERFTVNFTHVELWSQLRLCAFSMSIKTKRFNEVYENPNKLLWIACVGGCHTRKTSIEMNKRNCCSERTFFFHSDEKMMMKIFHMNGNKKKKMNKFVSVEHRINTFAQLDFQFYMKLSFRRRRLFTRRPQIQRGHGLFHVFDERESIVMWKDNGFINLFLIYLHTVMHSRVTD